MRYHTNPLLANSVEMPLKTKYFYKGWLSWGQKSSISYLGNLSINFEMLKFDIEILLLYTFEVWV